MKCDSCEFKTGYTLGPDECGAGSFFPYCAKDHWAGDGPDSEEEYLRYLKEPDPWVKCNDYKKLEKKNEKTR